jgi:histidyl-tRNA synthetase
MRDASRRDLAHLKAASDVCRELFARRGYVPIDTPIMEETELFQRKSGGELASRLYSFVEPGGYAVSLRPEFTAPVLRHAIESGAASVLPLRYQYCGPVFRHTHEGPAEAAPALHFTQAGAELIGASGPRADGEVIGMAWEGLRSLGVSDPQVTVGHVGLIWEALRPLGLSERARLFLVNSVSTLRTGPEGRALVEQNAAKLGLTGPAGAAAPPLVREDGDHTLRLVESVLGETLGEPVARYAGTRTSAEIVARLARKLTLADDPAQFAAGLDLMARVALVRGHAAEAIDSAARVLKSAGLGVSPDKYVGVVVAAAVDEGVPANSISIDLGLARGIAYYTGVVFDLSSGPGAAGASLGGGGRYDGLLKSLGASRDAPALGFAYNLDAVVAAIGGRQSSPGHVVMVVPADAQAHSAAARHAARLRERGETVLLEVEVRGREHRALLAESRGVRSVITVAADGRITEGTR